MQRRLSLSTSSSSASPSPSPARHPSPSPAHPNRVQSSFLAPPPLPSLRRSSSRSLLSPLNTSSPSSSMSAVAAVSSAPPATPSRPIPISPPSAHPSRAQGAPNSLPQTGGSATTNARRTHAVPLEPYSHRHRRGEEEEEDESEGSFTIPILDTRTLSPLRSSGAPTSSLTPGAAVARGAGGRRLSCLASYTGLPLPPPSQEQGGGGGDELRYSLRSFRSSQGQGQAQGFGRRPSLSGGGAGAGAGSSIVRPPSPAPEAFARRAVSPLTSAGGGAGAGEAKRGRRESVVLGQGSLAALVATTAGGGGEGVGGRRAPSPARLHAHAPGASGTSGLVRSASTSRQNAARGDAPRVVRGFDPPQPSPSSSGQRAPSPARFGGGGGAGGSTAAPPPASSHLSARRASLSASSSPLLRPRSRLANPQSDQHLEVAASRDIAALDAYYDSRKREGREGRREAEERLRVGYDRLQREL